RLDARHARNSCVQSRQVDELVGAEHGRHLEPFGYAVDDDDAAGAPLPGDSDRVQSEAASALNDDGLAHLDIGQVPARRDLGHGAVDPGDDLVGQRVWHFEHDVVRVQVEKVTE